MTSIIRALVRNVALPGLAILLLAPPGSSQAAPAPHRYLFVWTGDGARKVSDFLAVLDAEPASPQYGHVVASLAVGALATMPHHTLYEFPANGMLLVNGWAAGRTFLLDLRNPLVPKLAASFGSVGPYSFAHSFVAMPNGHFIGTFQGHNGAYAPAGGLAELDDHGQFIRGATAAGAGLADTLAWPYSLALDTANDRIVVTNGTMPMPPWRPLPSGSWSKARVDSVVTSQVQFWSLSRLQLLSTLTLPRSGGKYPPSEFPAEPRLLPDGSIYVNTFNCGLYHLTDMAGAAPHATLVHTFPIASDKWCAVPAIVGRYWIQTVAALPGLIALDIGNPAHPVEVSRLRFTSRFAMPHWLAADSRGSRVVVTGDNMGYVLVVNVDPRTGQLTLDSRFRDERTGAVGVSLDGREWPQGAVKAAAAHGALFGPR